MKCCSTIPGDKPTLNLTAARSARCLAVDEAPLSTDKDSASSSAFGAFHGYGISGTAAGQVVYANYARPEDFAALEKLGVSVKGKIVLARYGGNFRGLKVLNAQKRGAAGILIYSDPADDGYARGDVYPAGPYRPGSAIQRGSVQFLSLGPGDPSTPNGPSVKNADRLPIDAQFRFSGWRSIVKEWEAKTGLKRQDYFATIPSLPISYDTAKEILRVLAGPNVPSGWQGGLPLAYHVGPGPAEVEFSVSDGLPGPADLERDRDDSRDRRARSLDHGGQPPRRLGLRRRRSRAAARPRRWRCAGRSARRSRRAGSRAGPSSTRAGTPRNTAWSARPNGPRSMPGPSTRRSRFCSTSTRP